MLVVGRCAARPRGACTVPYQYSSLYYSKVIRLMFECLISLISRGLYSKKPDTLFLRDPGGRGHRAYEARTVRYRVGMYLMQYA